MYHLAAMHTASQKNRQYHANRWRAVWSANTDPETLPLQIAAHSKCLHLHFFMQSLLITYQIGEHRVQTGFGSSHNIQIWRFI